MTIPSFQWQLPVPIGSVVLPEWPNDIFIEEVQKFVCELAKSTETPLELSSLTVLSAISTATHGKYLVQVKTDYFEPVNVWTVVGLPPGCRKTAVQKAATEPILQWEQEKRKELEPIIAKVISENKSLEVRIKELRKIAGQAKADEYDKMKDEITKLESQIKPVPAIPQMWTSDITPENLGTLMSENYESMAVLSDEAGIFDILSGRYSSGVPNLDLFLQGHAGSPVRVNRGCRPPVFLNHPSLTLGLTPQPDMLRGLTRTSAFRGRGLLGRFLYAIPPSNLGQRSLDAEPMNEETKRKYGEVISDILCYPRSETGAHVLNLSKEAYEDWRAYALVIEINMGEGGQFAYMQDWAGKLPGAIIRIAALLHIARYAQSFPLLHEIGWHDIKAAIRIGHKLAEHAIAVFDLMGADPSLDGARLILQWIQKHQLITFTYRDCHYAHKSRFKKAVEMAPCMAILVEHFFIIECEVEKMAHRPSRIYNVNPNLYK
jgi:hypothetical protein